MQNLSKNCSLDCSSSASAGAARGRSATSGAGGAPTATKPAGQYPLAHSVSIVVEPAQVGGSEKRSGADWLSSLAEPPPPPECGRADAPEVSVNKGPEEEAEDEEADEEVDEDACLSSDLARRVVLVDEADRIFIRNRTQSAEPSDLSACCRNFSSGSSERRSESTSPPALPRFELSCAELRSAQRKCRTHSLGPSSCVAAAAAAAAAAAGGHGDGSSGELAERGELSKLGMRRNTHHHVNFAGAAPLAMRPNATANRSPTRFPFHLGSSRGNNNNHNLETQQAFHKQHRRQSLQISLLTGGHYCCRDTSRSLTEEELRGEREFNEQVRSAAKSPEFSSRQQQQQQRHYFSGQKQLRPVDFGQASLASTRHQSTSSLVFSSDFSSDGSRASLLAEQATREQPRVKLAGSQRSRRVSFGSIDPIVLAQSEQPPSCHQRSTTRGRQRASIHSELPTSNHQDQAQQVGGILRKLERVSAANHPLAQQKGILQQRQQPSCHFLEDSCLLQRKRHSLAAPAASDSQQQQAARRQELNDTRESCAMELGDTPSEQSVDDNQAFEARKGPSFESRLFEASDSKQPMESGEELQCQEGEMSASWSQNKAAPSSSSSSATADQPQQLASRTRFASVGE